MNLPRQFNFYQVIQEFAAKKNTEIQNLIVNFCFVKLLNFIFNNNKSIKNINFLK